jgi:hypothetical protein
VNNDSDSGYLRDYLDFDLEISEGESRGYAVAVHSPAGEAQEEMSFPFDERQLRDKLKDLEIALLRSGGTRRSLSSEEQTVQDFGRSLFEAVLVGKVGTCYYRSMDQARQQGKEVQSGTSVSVTVSSGFSTSKVPDLRGKLPDEARYILDGAGLNLGTVGKVPSDEVAENKIVKHYPTAGSEVKQGTSVRVTVADK